MFSKDRDDVDDMFQEILIKLWNGYEKFRGESDVKTWIYRVSLNCCLNQQKKRRREPDHIALTMDIDPFEGISDRSLQTKRLYDRINHLGLIDRAIILLWLEGMTYEEIGAIIGISVTSIVRRLKQESTRELWNRHPEWLRKHFWKERTFWSDGYFVCSIGEASPETVRRYIENQG